MKLEELLFKSEHNKTNVIHGVYHPQATHVKFLSTFDSINAQILKVEKENLVFDNKNNLINL